ncbi:MAG: type III pantothenate kinase [Muribaculaceae bacterium]|nr:type III pantothenate kinase [Muribaculaceae bacterium]MDE6486510.1 type III pantothenate kinase [Muribaculaceae bacterium]
MALYATIDQGNTATKLTVWRDGSVAGRVMSKTLSAEAVAAELRRHGRPAAGIYCSVGARNEAHIEELRKACDRLVELTHETPLPIELRYRTAGTLGLDRVAAAAGAVAAYAGRRCLVADIGTAVTYDVVGPDAAFHGGNIAPGAGMRLRSLHAYTAKLPETSVDGELPEWGEDTETAMRCGALYGIAGELTYYLGRLPEDTLVVLTGGRAETIAPLLNIEYVRDPDLVGKGLVSILEHNIKEQL